MTDDELACPHCGARGPRRRTVLVVTRAAATGKSTVATELAGAVPGVTFLDGDVVAEGASAVEGDRRDYVVYWGYALLLCQEVAANDLLPLICGIGLPEQPERNPEHRWFRSVKYMALVCQEDELRHRTSQRMGAGSEVDRVEFHLRFNRRIRELAQERSDMAQLDVTQLDSSDLVAAVRTWIDSIVLQSSI